jgi:hypothetical protein
LVLWRNSSDADHLVKIERAAREADGLGRSPPDSRRNQPAWIARSATLPTAELSGCE